MEAVGVRELRQNASRLLERVAAGETLVITSRGREVARLVPSPGAVPSRQQLIDQGLLVPGRGSVLDVEPVLAADISTKELLEDLRADRE